VSAAFARGCCVALCIALVPALVRAQPTTAGARFSAPPCISGPNAAARARWHDALSKEGRHEYASARAEREALNALLVADTCLHRDVALQELRVQNLIDSGLDAYKSGSQTGAFQYWSRALALVVSPRPEGETAFAHGRYASGFRSYCDWLCNVTLAGGNPVFADAGAEPLLIQAVRAGSTSDYRSARDLLTRAVALAAADHLQYGAALYFLGVTDEALGANANACRSWLRAVEAQVISPDFLSHYDGFTLSALRSTIQRCANRSAT
jgi:tetratricopeptide (TPR) repeat protein